MTKRQTSAFSNYILVEIKAAEQRHSITLDASDRLLLIETIARMLVHGIDKYIRGAKSHGTPIIERVTFDDVLNELTDAMFYNAALAKRITATAQQATLTATLPT